MVRMNEHRPSSQPMEGHPMQIVSSRPWLVSLLAAAIVVPLLLLAATAQAQTTGTTVPEPGTFTSTFSVRADADQVPEGDDGMRGEPGATGTFNLRVDSSTDTICHDIVLRGVTPPFESPAPTATHIHDGPSGEAGPAVWLFPNPEMSGDGTLTTSGCLQEAFTGDGNDRDFTVAELEGDPTGYYVDNHTSEFVPGAVRGQFGAATPAGGVAAGAGGSAGGLSPLAIMAALGLTMVGGAALTIGGRRSSVRA
jgi:hypothetical protein